MKCHNVCLSSHSALLESYYCSTMGLEELQNTWEKFAENDPLWAILTWEEKRGNKWTLNDFFATGGMEINSVMEQLRTQHISVANQKALDFGCGVGRLTQALTHYFWDVVGVDIAPSMIELACRYNERPDVC